MSRNYSPKTFLRQTPNHILQEYFHNKGLLKEIPFEKLGETEIDPIAQAMEEISYRNRKNIEADFRRINEMACAKGVQNLIEEAGYDYHDIALPPVFASMKNHYERAFRVFLNHREVFDIARDMFYLDSLESWSRRKVGVGLSPANKEQDKRQLADNVSEFYRKQGRGYHCHVDNYLRQEPERHCYFVYPEDYASTELGFDDEGKFNHRVRQPAFEVIFVYRPQSGILEVNAKGGTKVITALQEIFCTTILGLEGLPDLDKTHFNLSGLIDKDLEFITEPADGIEKVILKMLRLDLPGSGKRRITFEAEPTNGQQPVNTLIKQALNKSNLPVNGAVITKAKIQLQFAAKDGKRGRSLTFEIAIPDRCSLKDGPLEQIAKKYIEKWGLLNG